MFEQSEIFRARFFKKPSKIYNGDPHSKLPGGAGLRESMLVIFHDFSWIFARKNVFSSSPDLYRCEISWGIHFWWFQSDTSTQSWSKVEKNWKNRQTRFSGHPPPKSLSNYPASDCSKENLCKTDENVENWKIIRQKLKISNTFIYHLKPTTSTLRSPNTSSIRALYK